MSCCGTLFFAAVPLATQGRLVALCLCGKRIAGTTCYSYFSIEARLVRTLPAADVASGGSAAFLVPFVCDTVVAAAFLLAVLAAVHCSAGFSSGSISTTP